MLRNLPNLGRNLTSLRFNSAMQQFFDDEANFGKSELRPKNRPGRSWTEEELRLKSNSDLHKLWYVCLKERNMLLTMKKAHIAAARNLPNPERLDRVEETMGNIENVVHERNDAVYKLETGESAKPRERNITSFAGFTYKKQVREHLAPASITGKKEYEIPYLEDDAYMMQKLWNEKEFMKRRDKLDDEMRREKQTETMKRYQRGAPRVFNK
ncbi:unnamed protein product [Caenorhabditis angaria]|uniref:Large ribosomal subunit protein uL29m n=1 Tax=Caenorhabditis angaria TaxID=860376 RepID=A0A9P1I495_9PELO|nr:unnamed protein product [Caenorhabditis angaria]